MADTAIPVDPRAIASTLGISVYELALQQSRFASDALQRLAGEVDLTRARRVETLDEFDEQVAQARRHFEGALTTYALWEEDDDA